MSFAYRMRASECPIDFLFRKAITNQEIANLLSFVQVEYGLIELKSHWAGFQDVSDHVGIRFDDCDEIVTEFCTVLNDYLEYLQEPASHKVGQ